LCFAINPFLQELAKQVANQAQRLQVVGERLRLSTDQEQQLQKIAALEKSFEELKAEDQKQVDLLQTRIDTLGKDKATLEERILKRQEKKKVWPRRRKVITLPKNLK
jgi:hypothetical protein